MTGTPPHAAWTWLARAHPDPGHALGLLLRHGRAALPTGGPWDMVQVPETTGLLALAKADGPAFRDSARRAVVFLVAAPGGWGVRGTAHLTGGVMVCTPAPDLHAPDPAGTPGLYWLAPPDGSGLLVDPVVLFEALAAAGPQEEGVTWCCLCGRPGPTTTVHRPGLSGPGGDVPAHASCATAGIVDGRLHRR